jgi:ankyrin repeat protein
MRSVVLFALLAQGLCGQTVPQVRDAIARAIPVLERSAAAFTAKRACVSCHHNILPILMLHMARDRGLPVDPAVLSTVEQKTFRALRGPAALDDAIRAVTLDDPTPDDSFLLIAAHAAGLPPDLTTSVYARRLAAWQRDGHWVTSDFRPPHSSSLFTATASAVRAIRLYMPDELTAERDAVLLRARGWLSETRPASTEDASFRLMGLVWAAAAPAEIAGARHDLTARRSPSGGWPELPGYSPDAYSTGEALYALRESGTPVTDPIWRMGSFFLTSTQSKDGTWRVHTRMISPAQVSPEYFSTGFPYAKDEYLSYAGSVWAVMALLEAMPVPSRDPLPSDRQGASAEQGWVRTALFGTPQQLSALLDAGLNPNTATPKGTTLLMMAAPDADKVKLLLARGATSGLETLTIAAAYRNSAPAIKLLLDAKTDPNPPKGARVKKLPLTFAAMAGDLENVKLLLDHGADPTDALAPAVTFGYPEIVKALIAAGASAKGTESSGINLLHWAVITNHPEVIPALVEAGVPVNATDNFGYTPLMYAATIDFGNPGAIAALLKAGADPKVRNDEGRTALEQARFYHHGLLEQSLH